MIRIAVTKRLEAYEPLHVGDVKTLKEADSKVKNLLLAEHERLKTPEFINKELMQEVRNNQQVGLRYVGTYEPFMFIAQEVINGIGIKEKRWIFTPYKGWVDVKELEAIRHIQQPEQKSFH